MEKRRSRSRSVKRPGRPRQCRCDTDSVVSVSDDTGVPECDYDVVSGSASSVGRFAGGRGSVTLHDDDFDSDFGTDVLADDVTDVDDVTRDELARHEVDPPQSPEYRETGRTVTCGFRELVKPNMAAFTRSVRSALEWRLPTTNENEVKVQGSSGFEDLRRYIKQGGDNCKDIASILQERSELEALYAKGLGKLSNKTARIARDSIGTLAQAYQGVSAELEAEGELHKTLALALVEEIVKPLRVLIEVQHKARKVVESTVDKVAKVLGDLRSTEGKAKKNCYVSAKENERMQMQMLDAKLGRSKIMSDKETAKLESKKRKTEDAVKKSDYEYYSVCVTAERARLEWETSVVKGCTHFQYLEEERLLHMQDVLKKYSNHWQVIGPKMIQGSDRLMDAVNLVNVATDINMLIAQRGNPQSTSEQMLPDFYAEDLSNMMNKERRREALEKFMLLIKHDIERERRGKQGVENLARVFQETPNFGDQEAQNDVKEKLQHMRAMLAYFEATRFKLHCCLSDLEGRTKPIHPLSRHIEQHKDKLGQVQTILKVPSWVKMDRSNSDQGWEAVEHFLDRGSADGTSHSPDNYDEFSLSSHESSSYSGTQSSVIKDPLIKRQLSLCKALYDYEANLYDELTIHLDDIITVYDKQDDGWWHGELNGVVGIFPATYVEEIN